MNQQFHKLHHLLPSFLSRNGKPVRQTASNTATHVLPIEWTSSFTSCTTCYPVFFSRKGKTNCLQHKAACPPYRMNQQFHKLHHLLPSFLSRKGKTNCLQHKAACPPYRMNHQFHKLHHLIPSILSRKGKPVIKALSNTKQHVLPTEWTRSFTSCTTCYPVSSAGKVRQTASNTKQHVLPTEWISSFTSCTTCYPVSSAGNVRQTASNTKQHVLHTE